MSYGYLVAAVMAWMTCAIHVVVGGRELVRPLLASRELHRVVRVSHHFCWHLVSISLAAIALALSLAAYDAELRLLGRAGAGLAAAFGLLNLGFAIRHRLSPRWLPQWLLFAAIVAPAVVAEWAAP